MHSNWLKAVFLQLDGNMASFNIIITSELHIYISSGHQLKPNIANICKEGNVPFSIRTHPPLWMSLFLQGNI